MFLYIDPLKQGLKRKFATTRWHKLLLFLYIDPLKQGLKLCFVNYFVPDIFRFYT